MAEVPNTATYQLHVSVGNDTTPPDTTITEGPAETVGNDSATFSFSASEESTFECRLDEEDFTSCDSGITYTGLSLGSHTFEVQATDEAGNVEIDPASHTWTYADQTAPTVLSTNPSDGATKVSRTDPDITATFSEAMERIEADSITLQKVRVRGRSGTFISTVSTSVDQSNPTVVRLSRPSLSIRGATTG